jgi:four helix bundle protein
MIEERSPAKTFVDLLVWRKAHEYVLSVYKLTSTFPRQEVYGLCSQMRRAAVSIPANIAEGFRKRGKADKARFMNTAEGSVEESRYYLILAGDLGYAQTGGADEFFRRGEQATQRLCRGDSLFQLLTSDFFFRSFDWMNLWHT